MNDMSQHNSPETPSVPTDPELLLDVARAVYSDSYEESKLIYLDGGVVWIDDTRFEPLSNPSQIWDVVTALAKRLMISNNDFQKISLVACLSKQDKNELLNQAFRAFC